ncbi:CLUMA_CG019003, isoform A [Clunio marinus]|uniref:CLUMA_CG019003, isoform A n=1 Tax=Clunio marinus TaxID=568069 RepID=A0A1J1J2M4_9DIPT|nr:CLUMA_CG019003, isoform A [Clunio marinus]
MISRIKILLILTSVLITPIKCAICRFYLDTNSIYGCEMFEVNVTEENQTFEITGDHLSGYSDTNVTWLNVTDSGVLNFISLTIFETFANLQTADLSKVEVKEIRQENFLKIHSVRTIILEGNSIQKIPSMAFMNCWQLRDLRLNDNAIDTIEDYAFSTEWSVLLNYLTLSNNLIKTLPENAFAGLTSLSSLYLDGNQITELPENIFISLLSLRVLNLDNNHLVSLLPDLFTATFNLNYLSIRSNQLESLDFGLSYLDSLSELYIEHNKISFLESSFFYTANKLRIFEASWNNLSSIVNITFQNSLSNELQYVGLSHNSLTEIFPRNFQRLSNLRELRLNDNKISSLPNDIFARCFFAPCRGPSTIDLSNNELEVIDSKLFTETFDIQNLNLANNKISAIDRNTFGMLPNIKNIFLAGNLCFGDDFKEITREDMDKINESLEECYRKYDELNNSTYPKYSFTTMLITVTISAFLSQFTI